jgi:hypothetical protein
MQSKEHRNSVGRTKLWLIAGLMVVSTILFVIGVTIERSGAEAHEIPAAHQEAGEAQEAGETHSEEGEATHSEAANETHSKTIFGVNPGFNLESPWLVATAALGSLALVVALFQFGHAVLIVVIPVAILMVLLDIAEVMIQVGEGNVGLAILATIIGLMRAAVAILAIITLREWRTSLRQVDASSHQSAT